MTRPLRDTNPSKTHLITIRTAEAAIWMLPTDYINRLIGGIIARYQEIFQILIFAYSFQGNHYHMLLQAPLGHLDEFLENVNREIARRLNRHFGRTGKFWGRRYDDLIVPTQADALDAFLYVTTNPSKHRLVSHPKDWPGLNCYSQILHEADLVFEFTHYSNRTKGELRKSKHKLKVTPLPQYADLPRKERRMLLLKLINGRIEEIRATALQEGERFGTPSSLRAQKPGSLPKRIARSPRPVCYSKDSEVIREFKKEEELRRQRYSIASFQYRGGNANTTFPSFTFKPPLHRKPRTVRFGHLLQQFVG